MPQLSNIAVRYNDTGEFLEELSSLKTKNIHGRLVRMTTQYRTNPRNSTRQVSVLSSFITSAETIIYLEADCGTESPIGMDEINKKVFAKRDSFYRDIQAACAVKKLKISGGVHEFNGITK
jgi:hypothetical protein